MPRPRRNDLTRRAIMAIVFICAGYFLIGYLFLWLHPANDMDKRCLRATMAELSDCMRYNNEHLR